jgi:hypothetical protein
MFGISNCFTDDFQRFGHRLDLLLSGLARREGCQRAFLEERPPLHLLASAASSRLEYKTCFKDVHSKLLQIFGNAISALAGECFEPRSRKFNAA